MKPTMLSPKFVEEYIAEIWDIDPDPDSVEFERKMRDVRCTYCAGWEL